VARSGWSATPTPASRPDERPDPRRRPGRGQALRHARHPDQALEVPGGASPALGHGRVHPRPAASLVASFKATLEEAARPTCCCHVADASTPRPKADQGVNAVLEELGLASSLRSRLNKVDRVTTVRSSTSSAPTTTSRSASARQRRRSRSARAGGREVLNERALDASRDGRQRPSLSYLAQHANIKDRTYDDGQGPAPVPLPRRCLASQRARRFGPHQRRAGPSPEPGRSGSADSEQFHLECRVAWGGSGPRPSLAVASRRDDKPADSATLIPARPTTQPLIPVPFQGDPERFGPSGGCLEVPAVG